ncbi:MAG: hypothetical protein MK297_12860 [Planctomycetes bacterium]|nr:hypothetical protein [Planctomycetota bacterium]
MVDPFEPGLRWSRQSAADTPWIPGRVLFTDGDQLAWASSGPLGACIEAYSAWGTGQQEVLSRSEEQSAGARVWDLAGSPGSDALFAVIHAPALLGGEVRLVRYPAPSAQGASASQPLWSVPSPAIETGSARVACDSLGDRVCFASWDAQQKRTYVRWHRASDGGIVGATEVVAADLDLLIMSADGGFTLATAGERVWVWDSSSALIHYEVTGAEVRIADFDADGAHLLLGHGSRARLLTRTTGGFLELARVDGASTELAACGALSESGGGWAVAWCDDSLSTARFSLYEGLSDVLLSEHQQSGAAGRRQNIPQAVSITPGGERAAFATWGDGEQEELLLLDTAGFVWAVDLPGSATDVALDRSGRRLLVSHKDAHANEASAGGAVRLFDTGEGDLALIAAPRPGGALSVECEAAGASVAFFLFGEPVETAVDLPFVYGELWVSLHSRLLVRARRPGRDGHARCELNLPESAAGLELAVQAVMRREGALEASADHLIVRPR